MNNENLDIVKTRAMLMDELFSLFHNRSEYCNAKEFRAKHDEDIRIIDGLVKDEVLREDQGYYEFSLFSYMESPYWEKEVGVLDVVFRLFRYYYKTDPNASHSAEDILRDAWVLEKVRLFGDMVDRAIILLGRMLFIGGGTLNPDTFPRKFKSFQIREDVLYYKTVGERVQRMIEDKSASRGTPSPAMIPPFLKAAAIHPDTIHQNYELHPEITSVSRELFDNEHYPQAVEAAFKKVITVVKGLLTPDERGKKDGDALMNLAFGAESQPPLIKFNSLTNLPELDEQRGIMYLFKGMVAIRNRKAHDFVQLSDSARAFEYLALASLLLRLLETTERYKQKLQS